MKTIPIQEIKDRDTLAKDILEKNGDVLLQKGTALKNSYITLLDQLDIIYVDIESEKKIKEYCESDFSSVLEELKNILSQHIYKRKSLGKINELSEKILEIANRIRPTSKLLKEEPDLYTHTIHVAILANFVARKIGLEKKLQKKLMIGSLLHDIGLKYITIDYTTLNKNNLTPMEVFEFKKHTIYGYEALEKQENIDKEYHSYQEKVIDELIKDVDLDKDKLKEFLFKQIDRGNISL